MLQIPKFNNSKSVFANNDSWWGRNRKYGASSWHHAESKIEFLTEEGGGIGRGPIYINQFNACCLYLLTRNVLNFL